MKFKVTTVATHYDDIKTINALKSNGFIFDDNILYGNGSLKMNNHVEVEINTLEELLEFSRVHKKIILEDGIPWIEIYDDYIE